MALWGINTPRGSEPNPSFPLPSETDFARLGLRPIRELHGGFQSRVVLAEATNGGGHLAVKLIDASAVDRAQAMARLQVRDRVAHYDDRVIPIVPIAGAKVNRIANCLAVASPFVNGRFPDIANGDDTERMGRALARLHQSLRLVSADLPAVAPLRAGAPVEGLLDNHQLLHGDFGPSNLLLDDDGRLWILDFEECGHGPVEFELGNTLFMALFDSSPSLNQPSDDYRNFRRRFLSAYQGEADHAVSMLLVDLAVQARSDALRFWLRNLDQAPIGIRTASPEWHRHLQAFASVISP